MLIQQLRQLEADGVVARTVYAVVPPRVEYHLTEWGQTLCPVLDNLLKWAESAPDEVRARLIDHDAVTAGG
jgi:DNA-binding HxlR family transcriptional regulator